MPGCNIGSQAGIISLGQCFAKSAHYQQCIVDAQAKAEHRRQILHQNRQVQIVREQRSRTQRHRDGEYSNSQRQWRGNKTSESQQQQQERYRQRSFFGMFDVIGADLTKIEGQWCFTRNLQFDIGVL